MRIKFSGINENGEEISTTLRIIGVDDLNFNLGTYAVGPYTSASVLDGQDLPVMILVKDDNGRWSIDY